MLEPDRRNDVLRFLDRHQIDSDRLELLAGDVSARRYVRAHGDHHTFVVAVYPDEMRETARRFLTSTRLLTEAEIRVPRVLAVDRDADLMLLEDVGDATLRVVLEQDPNEEESVYRRCEELVDRIARLPVEEVRRLNPALDGEHLRRELRQSWDELLVPLGLAGREAVAEGFRQGLSELCGVLGASLLVPCHRDFMVRNLVLHDGEIVVLDHQDLRLGPPTYDLASLLNDTRFASDAVEAALLERAGFRGHRLVDYRRAVVQRCLKAAGTFARAARRGDSRHRELIPPTLGRCWRHLGAIPELRDLRERLRPAWEGYLRAHDLLESAPD